VSRICLQVAQSFQSHCRDQSCWWIGICVNGITYYGFHFEQYVDVCINFFVLPVQKYVGRHPQFKVSTLGKFLWAVYRLLANSLPGYLGQPMVAGEVFIFFPKTTWILLVIYSWCIAVVACLGKKQWWVCRISCWLSPSTSIRVSLCITLCHYRWNSQGRIIYCAGCTKGGGLRRQGPPDQLPNFLTRCFDILTFSVGLNVTTTKKGRQLFLGEKCTTRKILATRTIKGPPPYIGMAYRCVSSGMFKLAVKL